MTQSFDYSYRGNPNEFMARVSRIPNVEAEDELALIDRWQHQGDQKALNTLLAAHQKFLVKTIYKFRLVGHFEDALQAGNIGMMKAVERFNSEANVRFSTYAAWWIRAELGSVYPQSMVKVETTPARKIVKRHLARAIKHIRGDDMPATYKDLMKAAAYMNVDIKDVMDIYPLMGGDISLDAPLTNSDGEESRSRMVLTDQQPDPEYVIAQIDEVEKARMRLQDAMEVLGERARYIFEARRLADPPATLDELAQKFNVSRERVRQIEVRAFDKVAAVMRGEEARDSGKQANAPRSATKARQPEPVVS